MGLIVIRKGILNDLTFDATKDERSTQHDS